MYPASTPSKAMILYNHSRQNNVAISNLCNLKPMAFSIKNSSDLYYFPNQTLHRVFFYISSACGLPLLLLFEGWSCIVNTYGEVDQGNKGWNHIPEQALIATGVASWLWRQFLVN